MGLGIENYPKVPGLFVVHDSSVKKILIAADLKVVKREVYCCI